MKKRGKKINLKNKDIKLLIFDFDGTIADTKKMYYKIITKYLKENGYKLKRRQFKEFFGMKLSVILKHLKISKNTMKIKKQIKDGVFKNLNKIKVSRDVKYIKELKNKYQVIVISNTFSGYINKVLRHNKIKNLFSEVYGGENFHYKGDFLKKLIRKKKLEPKQVVYIGDMALDVKAARTTKCHSIIIKHKISWDSAEKIQSTRPDLIIKNFKELKKTLN